MAAEVKTYNDFFIGTNGQEIGPPLLPLIIKTKQQAYRTAIWIKLMGDVLPDENPASTFGEIEKAIWDT